MWYLLLLSALLCAGKSGKAQPTVSISLNSAGLSSLSYNGIQFLSYGDLRVDQVTFVNSNGSTYSGSTLSTVAVDVARQTQTRTYPWGAIVVTYAVTGNRLSVVVTVNNRSAATLRGIWLEPFGLHFPNAVREYNGVVPLIVNTLGQPAVQQMTHSSGVLVLAADDVTKALQLGFPWSTDRSTNNTFPLTLNTDRVAYYPTQYPTIVRPISPGGSDQFRFSLRFGPPNATNLTLAADVYEAFAAAYPPALAWPDRRPIGQLVISTAATGWTTNPRGWLLDPGIDVTTPAGVANLKQRILAWAASSVSILQGMNAQGMVTWDIEGQQYVQPISYIGDPTLFAVLAPEMNGIADAYFQTFRNAGLRVGVCIRPQQLTLSKSGGPPQQVGVANPTQLLINKVRYAKGRWGATLFYVDSNVNVTDPNPIDATIFKTLQATFPDSLFIPEHSNTRYYAYSAPYKELRQGYNSTPPDVRLVYPRSFTVVNTADGPIAQDFNQLVTAVQQGDSLLFRAWFADPGNQMVKSIYQLCGPPYCTH